ncbi:hypothetical protein ACTFIY_001199 [Dictyostelium cf. discoideum]
MTILIEFDSTQIYNNFECGGSLEIEFKNGTFWQNKTDQYPPCKSFYDASQRISQYNNYLKKYRNVKTIVLLNYDWKNVLLKPSAGFYIQNNCFFQIKLLNDTNSNSNTISIDGQNLNYILPFITLDYNVNNELYCDDDNEQPQQPQQQEQQEQKIIPVRFKLENFKLINFDNEFILVQKFYKEFKFKNKYQFVSFQLNSIITSKSSFLFENSLYDNDFQIQYLINDCHFSNRSTENGFIILGHDPFIISNSTFNNIKSGFPIINIFNLSITNCSFNNIINSNNKSIIEISNFGSFNNIKFNNFTSTILLLQSLDSISFNESSLKLSNIQINNNNNNNYNNNNNNNLFNVNLKNDNNYFNSFIELNQIFINNSLNNFNLILNVSKSFINVDIDSLNTFLLNSKLLFNGTNNIILLNNKNYSSIKEQLEFINNLNNCTDCIFSINGHNISTTIIKKDYSEFKLDSDSYIEKKGFNKIFLIPIILGSVLIITITIILLFKFKIINKKKNNQDNNNDINEENLDVVGEIVMDISSNLVYENYQCGGDLYIDDFTFNVYQNLTLPPCKSFGDIGKRLDNFQMKNTYINMSLIVLVYNYDSSIIIYNNTTIGRIYSFCNVEIINLDSKNNKTNIITIDGSNSDGDSFISFQVSLYSTTCENNFIGLKLNNLKFINWKYNIIEFSSSVSNWKYDQAENSQLLFNNVTIVNSNSFLNCFGNFNTTIVIDNCNFSNIYSSRYGFILISDGIITFNNCVFQNGNLNKSYLIDYGGDNIILNNCKFLNITISNNPLLFFSATKTFFKNVIIEKCNLNPYFLILKTTRKMKKFEFNQNFQDLKFNENYIKSSSNHDNCLIKYKQFDQTITNETLGNINIIFNNLQFTNSNEIEIGNSLISIPFNFSNDIKFLNSKINSNQLNNLIKTNFSKIEINNTILSIGDFNYKNSKYIIGLNNTILLNYNNILNREDLVRNIKNGCNNCTIIINDIVNSKNQQIKNENDGFKKVYIIPIVLVPLIVLIIILVLIIFRNNLKNRLFKNREQEATTEIIGSNISQRPTHINNSENEAFIDN